MWQIRLKDTVVETVCPNRETNTPMDTVTISNKITNISPIVIKKNIYTRTSSTILGRIIWLTIGALFPSLYYTVCQATPSGQTFPTLKDVTSNNHVYNSTSSDFQIVLPRSTRINCKMANRLENKQKKWK